MSQKRSLEEDGEAGPLLKSQRSIHHSFVRFVNKTGKKVDVVWMNYHGLGELYRTLGPDQFLDINTFVGHPWVFFDSDTGDQMVVQLRKVFQPVAWNARGEQQPERKTIIITLPVDTLQDCCLKRLRGLVNVEDVAELEIAQVLKEQLTKKFKKISVFQPRISNQPAEDDT